MAGDWTAVIIEDDPDVHGKDPVLEPAHEHRGPVGGRRGAIDDVPFARPPLARTERSGGISLRGMDGDAIPVVRPNPVYPPAAATRGSPGRTATTSFAS